MAFRHNWSQSRVYFYGRPRYAYLFACEWTDVWPPDPFVVWSAGRAAFRVADMLELRLISINSPKETSSMKVSVR